MWVRLPFGLLLLGAAAFAGLFHAGHAGAGSHSQSISLRKRLHVNTLITEPGTMEVEWGTAVSTGGSFTFPASLKYTPAGPHSYWGRTEFSVSFDSLASSYQPENRVTHFTDHVNLGANWVVHDGDHLDIAIAPQASFLLRGADGVRYGATAIARYDWGRNSFGGTMTWTGATVPSDSNPAGIFDWGLGYGRRLATQGTLGRLTAHTNLLVEKSTGADRAVSLFEGVEYQITEKLSVDFSGQHLAVWGGAVDHQVAVGLTMNLGRLRRK